MVSKFVVTDEFSRDGFACALCEAAGIKPEFVRRMVIDLQAGSTGLVYLEMFADDVILDVSIAELGISLTAEDGDA